MNWIRTESSPEYTHRNPRARILIELLSLRRGEQIVLAQRQYLSSCEGSTLITVRETLHANISTIAPVYTNITGREMWGVYKERVYLCTISLYGNPENFAKDLRGAVAGEIALKCSGPFFRSFETATEAESGEGKEA
ncbi:hypothetical protein PoB_000405100 [Plakobranchus ocellatus]|uniref:Uncharacterized protein n=1 Tax=Plakobranchus ocellatus TaxID=259542 RepID=A0AAV3Y556_9GAST|nr:hypothetical protein PoB_000405100 [Plakobranchus ocellatus]